MTEKRYFALIGEDGYVYPVFFDSENEDKEIDVDTVVDLLNENEQLKHDATVLIQANQEYRKENEQLKQQLKELKEDVPLLLAFYRWYPFAVEKKEHQAYNRLWDFVND